MLLALQLNNLLAGAPVTVPDVVGDDQATGTATLEGDGFVVVVATAYSSTVAAGLIISQAPTAGSSAAEGSSVTITVSLGAQPASDTGSAGFSNWYDILENQRRRKEKRKKEDEEVLEQLETKVDREIAQLIRKQEAQDEQRKDLERVKQLVQKYTDLSPKISSDRVNRAIEEAKLKQTLASYEKLQKEFIRMMEEEEVQVMLSLLL